MQKITKRNQGNSLCYIFTILVNLNVKFNGRLALGCDFGRAAADAVLDLTGDDDQELRKQRSLLKWDRKKKKFIGEVLFALLLKY